MLDILPIWSKNARTSSVYFKRNTLVFVGCRLFQSHTDALPHERARDAFSVTAARIRASNAFSSISSPSWKSMARLVLPSRLELKRPEGSSRAAPLAKVIFTTFLYVSPVQII